MRDITWNSKPQTMCFQDVCSKGAKQILLEPSVPLNELNKMKLKDMIAILENNEDLKMEISNWNIHWKSWVRDL